jgi:dipeptidyl aminopeptidase/acylaminoacyl peptidase
MKKYFAIYLLLVLLSSCSNDNPVSNPPITTGKDDIILTKNPHDSTVNVYGLNLSTMKQRYITNLGIGISNVFNNKVLLAMFGYYYFKDINLFDINTNVYNTIPIYSDYPFYLSLSPDASKVLYTTDEGNMLVVINSNGTNRRIFSTDIRGTETLAEFSPDGKQIAFVEKNSSYQSAIYIIDTSGNNKFKVMNISEPISGDRLGWSPDCKTIAFANKTIAVRNNIWKVNIDGSDSVNLTNYEYYESNPAFSPDGHYIAFVRYGSSGYTDIMYMKSDGSNIINLTNTPNEHEHMPSWSPDGKKIMYYKGLGGFNRFYIYDIASQNIVQIDTVFNAFWNYTK